MRDGYLRGSLSRPATQRQMDVLAAFVRAGGSVQDAADLVGIRPSTVKRHLADLRARSGLATEQLIYVGRDGGWLVVPSLEPRTTASSAEAAGVVERMSSGTTSPIAISLPRLAGRRRSRSPSWQSDASAVLVGWLRRAGGDVPDDFREQGVEGLPIRGCQTREDRVVDLMERAVDVGKQPLAGSRERDNRAPAVGAIPVPLDQACIFEAVEDRHQVGGVDAH